MSYSIKWHLKQETVYDYKTGKREKEYYLKCTKKRLEAKKLHSGECGSLDFFTEPFSVESTGLNVTSNLYEMFSWAINEDYTQDWKETIHGKQGKVIEPILRKAIDRMENNRIEAETYIMPEGWGTYSTALTFLKDLLAESIIYQDAYLEIIA